MDEQRRRRVARWAVHLTSGENQGVDFVLLAVGTVTKLDLLQGDVLIEQVNELEIIEEQSELPIRKASS